MSVFYPGMKQQVSRCTKKKSVAWVFPSQWWQQAGSRGSALQAMFTPVVVFRKYQTTLLNPPSSPCFSCNQCAQWRPCQDSGAVSPCSSPSNVPVTARPASGRMMLTASNPFLPLFTASHMFSCLRHLSRPWSVCSIPAYILTRKLHLPLKSMYKWYIL